MSSRLLFTTPRKRRKGGRVHWPQNQRTGHNTRDVVKVRPKHLQHQKDLCECGHSSMAHEGAVFGARELNDGACWMCSCFRYRRDS